MLSADHSGDAGRSAVIALASPTATDHPTRSAAEFGASSLRYSLDTGR